MTFKEIFSRIDGIEGWMGKNDCKALYNHATKVSGLIVEIGPYMGRSTKLLALSSPKSEVIAIDPFEDTAFYSHSGEIVKDNFLKNTHGLNITLIQKKSQNAGRGWKRSIDLLLVDGDHLYEAVKKDIKLFVSHVKGGCYVLFHDYYTKGVTEEYQPNKHGVSKAVDELKEKYFDEVLLPTQEWGFAICRRKR